MCDRYVRCSRCSYRHHEDYGLLSQCVRCQDRVCESCSKTYNGKVYCTNSDDFYREPCYLKVKDKCEKDKRLLVLFNRIDKIVKRYNDEDLVYLIEDLKEETLSNYEKPNSPEEDCIVN